MEYQKLVERLRAPYDKRPVIRALIQLIPYGIGSAIDAAVVTSITNIREERFRTFFDELERGEIDLSEEQISKENFLHAFFITTRAASNTRRSEKIKLFGKLFVKYCKSSDFEDLESLDIYEAFLSILEDLSYQEFCILFILRKFETAESADPLPKNTLVRTDSYWENFLNEIERKLKVSHDEVPGMLARLNRTGFYKTITGTYLNYEGDRGHLTANYYSFIKSFDEC